MLSANEIIAQMISFLILLFLLRIFAWKRILAVLDQRKERIANEFKNIEDAKHDIARLRSEYLKKLTDIEIEAKRKIDQAIAAGRDITDEIRKKANLEAQDIINNARASMRHELGKAKEELKEQIIDLTIRATESVIQDKLSAEDDKRLVEGFLKDLDKL